MRSSCVVRSCIRKPIDCRPPSVWRRGPVLDSTATLALDPSAARTRSRRSDAVRAEQPSRFGGLDAHSFASAVHSAIHGRADGGAVHQYQRYSRTREGIAPEAWLGTVRPGQLEYQSDRASATENRTLPP